MKWFIIIAVVLVLISLPLAAMSLSKNTYSISNYVVSSGGSTAVGNPYSLSDTSGQPAAGKRIVDECLGLALQGGFWATPDNSCLAYLPIVMHEPPPTPTPTPTPLPPTPSSCAFAQIVAPEANSEIPSPVTVSWVLDHCELEIHYYQNGRLGGRFYDQTSGTAVDMPPGYTQVKIWETGARLEADDVWITVID